MSPTSKPYPAWRRRLGVGAAKAEAFLHRFKTDWRLLVPILVADLAGMGFGWYYYWDVGQFNPASRFYESPGWWPLVADSPNAVLLFFVAVLAYRLTGWRNRWLDAFAFTLNIYVGLWTSFLFLSYPERMGTFTWGSTNNLLFFAHLGMPLQAFVLLRGMRRDSWAGWERLIVVAALSAFVGVDYWGPMLHPAPFLHPDDTVLHLVSPWLMVTAAAAWLTVVGLRARAPPGTPPP